MNPCRSSAHPLRPRRGALQENDPSLCRPRRLSLPKGGGAVRGIGEKFTANPVTGTASFSVPIATSPGRSGFGPQLVLSYDSGAGNGSFGLGWGLALPSITRKTDKGLPRVLVTSTNRMSSSSPAPRTLVPAYQKGADGSWARDTQGGLVHDEESRNGYAVKHYRPRIEGLFARIERWTRQADGDTHWRSISKHNVLTVYGGTADVAHRRPCRSRARFSAG